MPKSQQKQTVNSGLALNINYLSLPTPMQQPLGDMLDSFHVLCISPTPDLIWQNISTNGQALAKQLQQQPEQLKAILTLLQKELSVAQQHFAFKKILSSWIQGNIRRTVTIHPYKRIVNTLCQACDISINKADILVDNPVFLLPVNSVANLPYSTITKLCFMVVLIEQAMSLPIPTPLPPQPGHQRGLVDTGFTVAENNLHLNTPAIANGASLQAPRGTYSQLDFQFLDKLPTLTGLKAWLPTLSERQQQLLKSSSVIQQLCINHLLATDDAETLWFLLKKGFFTAEQLTLSNTSDTSLLIIFSLHGKKNCLATCLDNVSPQANILPLSREAILLHIQIYLQANDDIELYFKLFGVLTKNFSMEEKTILQEASFTQVIYTDNEKILTYYLETLLALTGPNKKIDKDFIDSPLKKLEYAWDNNSPGAFTLLSQFIEDIKVNHSDLAAQSIKDFLIAMIHNTKDKNSTKKYSALFKALTPISQNEPFNQEKLNFIGLLYYFSIQDKNLAAEKALTHQLSTSNLNLLHHLYLKLSMTEESDSLGVYQHDIERLRSAIKQRENKNSSLTQPNKNRLIAYMIGAGISLMMFLYTFYQFFRKKAKQAGSREGKTIPPKKSKKVKKIQAKNKAIIPKKLTRSEPAIEQVKERFNDLGRRYQEIFKEHKKNLSASNLRDANKAFQVKMKTLSEDITKAAQPPKNYLPIIKELESMFDKLQEQLAANMIIKKAGDTFSELRSAYEDIQENYKNYLNREKFSIRTIKFNKNLVILSEEIKTLEANPDLSQAAKGTDLALDKISTLSTELHRLEKDLLAYCTTEWLKNLTPKKANVSLTIQPIVLPDVQKGAIAKKPNSPDVQKEAIAKKPNSPEVLRFDKNVFIIPYQKSTGNEPKRKKSKNPFILATGYRYNEIKEILQAINTCIDNMKIAITNYYCPQDALMGNLASICMSDDIIKQFSGYQLAYNVMWFGHLLSLTTREKTQQNNLFPLGNSNGLRTGLGASAWYLRNQLRHASCTLNLDELISFVSCQILAYRKLFEQLQGDLDNAKNNLVANYSNLLIPLPDNAFTQTTRQAAAPIFIQRLDTLKTSATTEITSKDTLKPGTMPQHQKLLLLCNEFREAIKWSLISLKSSLSEELNNKDIRFIIVLSNKISHQFDENFNTAAQTTFARAEFDNLTDENLEKLLKIDLEKLAILIKTNSTSAPLPSRKNKIQASTQPEEEKNLRSVKLL